jgi:hypothetical protein
MYKPTERDLEEMRREFLMMEVERILGKNAALTLNYFNNKGDDNGNNAQK